MSDPASQQPYLEPYRRYQPRYGTDFGVTLWASRASQERRFAVFAEMSFLAGKRILDAGCSRGDLAAYLLEKGIEYGRYVGVDALEEVVAFARSRGLPRAEFHSGDLLADPGLLAIGDPQVVCISGTLNTMTDEQVTTLLEAAWAGTRETLMFNFLSDLCSPKAPPQDEFARRLSAAWLLRWAAGKTWCVALRQDYFPEGHDATILMRRV